MRRSPLPIGHVFTAILIKFYILQAPGFSQWQYRLPGDTGTNWIFKSFKKQSIPDL